MLMYKKFHLKKVTIPQWRKVILTLLALIFLLSLFAIGTQETFAERTPVQLIIDTDAGVDDATAIAWLLSQSRYPVEILGFTTVAGNSSVENVTNNVLTLLDVAERSDIPVVMGATQPLSQTLSQTPSLIHGPDGFWFTGMAHPHDLSILANDVPEFYRQMAVSSPGATLVALGPLTNLAKAVERYPSEMRQFGEIVILGGARHGGNQTPVTEFNFWQDPEAAELVLSSGLPITLIPLDAFSQFTITQENIDDLSQDGTSLAQLVATPLQLYSEVLTGFGGERFVAVPDATAVMYAANPHFRKEVKPALVKIMTTPGLARGQSIIGFTFSEKITMIASDDELSSLANQTFTDPDFDLESALGTIAGRELENAQVVIGIKQRWMRRNFMRGLSE